MSEQNSLARTHTNIKKGTIKIIVIKTKNNGKSSQWYICVCATKYNICFSFCTVEFSLSVFCPVFIFLLFFSRSLTLFMLFPRIESYVYVRWALFVLSRWFSIHFFMCISLSVYVNVCVCVCLRSAFPVWTSVALNERNAPNHFRFLFAFVSILFWLDWWKAKERERERPWQTAQTLKCNKYKRTKNSKTQSNCFAAYALFHSFRVCLLLLFFAILSDCCSFCKLNNFLNCIKLWALTCVTLPKIHVS